jgi:hypothetical protein
MGAFAERSSRFCSGDSADVFDVLAMNNDESGFQHYFLFAVNGRLVAAESRAPVAKWLTRRSAKPVFAGSKPARCSNAEHAQRDLTAVVLAIFNLFEERNS